MLELFSAVTLQGLFSKAQTTVLGSSKLVQVTLFILVLWLALFVFSKLFGSSSTSSITGAMLKDNHKGSTSDTISNSKLPPLQTGYEVTYASWVYIQSINSTQNAATHLFHVGNPDYSRLGPGVWIYPRQNDLAIKFTVKNYETRFTNGKVGQAPAKQPCLFPYKADWAKLGIQPPPHTNPEAAITTCSATRDNKSPEGYCPTKLNKGVADDLTAFGSCAPETMDPNQQPGILQTKLCDVQNVPLARWFHLAIVVNNETVEVYIDGRLVKSCVAPGLPLINEGDLYLTKDKNFDGELSQFTVFPRALNGSELRAVYMRGPHNDNTFSSSVKSFLNPFSNWSFSFNSPVKCTAPSASPVPKEPTTLNKSTGLLSSNPTQQPTA